MLTIKNLNIICMGNMEPSISLRRITLYNKQTGPRWLDAINNYRPVLSNHCYGQWAQMSRKGTTA